MRVLLYFLVPWLMFAQPARHAASDAYTALRAGRLDDAVAGFREAVRAEPKNPNLRKDFAYALLRTGEREEARDQIAAALELDPQDEQRGLEYAFLCYETRRPVTARRAFLRLATSANPEIREAAKRAFESIDQPLRDSIARWEEAIRRAPGQWSAHEELARLAEQRDEYGLAAMHYEQAWRLHPQSSALLLDLARVWKELGEEPKARAALVAAWRGGSLRIAETAREFMGGHVPGETEIALAMPEVPQHAAGASDREMGERSLELSYLDDALRYFTLAHEKDPGDVEAVYKLGVAANLLHRDSDALRWFDLARRAKDSSSAPKAQQAYEALMSSQKRFGVTAWAVPFLSTRWNDAFIYGQVRGEWKLKRVPITPYVSIRFVGDTQGRRPANSQPYSPLFLSETNIIPGVGFTARLGRNLYGWAEAGESVSYVGYRGDSGFARPDYRGGLSWLKGWGHLLGSPEKGWFAETNADSVYVSRFHHDAIVYSQTRTGYTLARTSSGLQVQALMNWNLTVDFNREYWANLVEAGPGVRLRLPGLPQGMAFRVETVRGANLVNTQNPRRPNFWDFRIGMWYAFAH